MTVQLIDTTTGEILSTRPRAHKRTRRHYKPETKQLHQEALPHVLIALTGLVVVIGYLLII